MFVEEQTRVLRTFNYLLAHIRCQLLVHDMLSSSEIGLFHLIVFDMYSFDVDNFPEILGARVIPSVPTCGRAAHATTNHLSPSVHVYTLYRKFKRSALSSLT